MKHLVVIMLLGLLCMGCRSVPEGPRAPLFVYTHTYDTVFNTIVEVLEKEYDVLEQDRDGGTVSTVYRLDRTLFEAPAQDSFSLYDRVESTLHMCRHRIRVTVDKLEDGGIAVDVQAFRQRQAFRGPQPRPIREVAYDVMDPERGDIDPLALQGMQSRWDNLSDNDALAAVVQRQIRRRLEEDPVLVYP